MSRWKVHKKTGTLWDGQQITPLSRWHVTSPTGSLWGNYATHAEALAYADKKARTVEVELPRVKPLEDIPIGNDITLSDPGPLIFFINGRGGEYICINDDEIKPLALALLAHHYKQEKA